MKSIAHTHRFTDRIVALFKQLFMRHTGSDKVRILANEKLSRKERSQQLGKISQAHW